jgi:hypothetical protein
VRKPDDYNRGSNHPVALPASLRTLAAFAIAWFGLLWALIAALAVHAYLVGEATSFRYVAF